MKHVPTEELVTLLVRDLDATGRLPRLRSQLAALLGGGGLVVFLVLAYRGVRPDARDLLLAGSAFSLVAAGLLAAALGVCTAVLALARPDRGAVARRGLILGVGGLLAALSITAWSFAGTPSVSGGRGIHDALACSASGIVFSVPLSLLATFLVSTGAPRRVGVAAAAAALGATAFGALSVHLSCHSPSVWHWITAHGLAPVAGALLLAAPLRAVTLRWERGG